MGGFYYYVESITGKQQPRWDGAKIDKPEQREDDNDVQDNNDQGNDNQGSNSLESHNNEGSRPVEPDRFLYGPGLPRSPGSQSWFS